MGISEDVRKCLSTRGKHCPHCGLTNIKYIASVDTSDWTTEVEQYVCALGHRFELVYAVQRDFAGVTLTDEHGDDVNYTIDDLSD